MSGHVQKAPSFGGAAFSEARQVWTPDSVSNRDTGEPRASERHHVSGRNRTQATPPLMSGLWESSGWSVDPRTTCACAVQQE